MRIIAIGAEAVAREVAERLGLPYVAHLPEISSDGFVLDGTRLRVADAGALDVVLRSRASEVDAVLWLDGGDAEVLERYRGRVIELDPVDPLESALAGLREVLLVS